MEVDVKLRRSWCFCFRVTVPTSPSLASGLGLSPAALPHLLSNSSASQQLLSAMQPQQLLQAAQAAQAQAAQAVQAAQASQQPLLTTSPQHHAHRHMNHYTVRITLTSSDCRPLNNSRLFRSRAHAISFSLLPWEHLEKSRDNGISLFSACNWIIARVIGDELSLNRNRFRNLIFSRRCNTHLASIASIQGTS